MGHNRNIYGTTECMCLYETLWYKHEVYITDSGIQILVGQEYLGIQSKNINLN